MHPTFCSLQSGWNLVFWCLTFRVHPTFCSFIFRVHPTFWSLKFVVHPIFCSIQDALCIQFYNIESAPLICPNIQGASSIEHTIYGHVLGHKGGARAPSAPWLDPPLLLDSSTWRYWTASSDVTGQFHLALLDRITWRYWTVSLFITEPTGQLHLVLLKLSPDVTVQQSSCSMCNDQLFNLRLLLKMIAINMTNFSMTQQDQLIDI